MITSLYTDAGICLGSPSKLGGSWACVAINEQDEEVFRHSYHVRPHVFGLDAVENNLLETFALAQGIDHLPDRFTGQVWCDNLNAIRRQQTEDTGFKFVPDWLRKVIRKNRERFPALDLRLCGGHPTRKELAAGRRKDGKPCSKWNVLCDEMCQKECADLLRELNYDGKIA